MARSALRGPVRTESLRGVAEVPQPAGNSDRAREITATEGAPGLVEQPLVARLDREQPLDLGDDEVGADVVDQRRAVDELLGREQIGLRLVDLPLVDELVG